YPYSKLGKRFACALSWHGLGKDLFMRVIDSLDNPIAVYRGTETASDTSRRSNYFLIITALTDAKDGTTNGNKINVPIYVEQKAFYNDVVIDANKIATAFGRPDMQKYIDRMVANKELVRVKRKSEVTSGWEQSPASSNNTFSNRTISQPTSGVNTHYMQNNKKDAKYSISGADAKKTIRDRARQSAYNDSQAEDMVQALSPYAQVYTSDITGDATQGDEVVFVEEQFTGSFKSPKFAGFNVVEGKIIKDSYGADKQQHTFTLELKDGSGKMIKGRNIYKYGLFAKPRDIAERHYYCKQIINIIAKEKVQRLTIFIVSQF
ncbi:MAG: hypothetical protein RR234_09630, partial [Christensenella sp.]